MHFYNIYDIITTEKSLVINLKCFIDYNIVNDNENIIKKDIKAIYNDNKLIYSDDKEQIKLIINSDNIILTKESFDSLIEFNFIKGKKNEFKYFIKLLNSYIDAYVYTKELIIKDNEIIIEYEIFIEDENVGNFKYKINIKENEIC